MAGDSGMMNAAQLRVQIIGDPTNIQHSLDSIVGATERTAGKMSSLFRDVGGVLTSAFAIGGGIALLGKGIDLASQQQSLQSVQATLLKNQNETQQSFIGGLQTVVGTQTAVNKKGEQYSKLLDQQATDLSFQSGIQKNQIIQAQNLLLPNTDLTSLYASQTQYSKTTGGYLNAAVEASANLAAQMGSGGSGIVGASRMVSRLLADPARSMGSMSRMGFHLALSQQIQIKNVQKQNGLLAAQQLILQDINGSLRGTAQAAISPVQRMQNDIMLIMQQMGRGLMPIIDNLAAVVGQTLYALDPIFNTVAQAIGAMSGTIGNTLGSISKIIQPLAEVFTQGVLPAILDVVQPIAEFIGVIGTQLNNIFNSKAVQTFIGLFASFGTTLGDAITPALKEISDVFTKMTSNGQLAALWTSFYQIFAALMPILPTLATAFANILTAMLPMVPPMVTIVTAMAKFAAFSLTKLVNAFDYLVKKISEFKPLFEIIMGALVALSAVFFAKHLFITPIQGFLEMMGKATRASLVFGETTKGALSGATKGFRDRGLVGILTGGQAGKAQAEYQQRQRDIIQALRLKQINPREALRAERENQIEGALAQEKYKNLRRSAMPLFGRAFMRKQEEGESDEAYAEYKKQQKSQRGVRAYLQGPTMDVSSYIKMMKLDEGEGEDENLKALRENTDALQKASDNYKKQFGGGKEAYKNDPTYQLMQDAKARAGAYDINSPEYSDMVYRQMTQMGQAAGKGVAESLHSEMSKPSFTSRLFGSGGFGKIGTGVTKAALGGAGAAASFVLGGGMGTLDTLKKQVTDLFSGKKVDWNSMITGGLQLSGVLGGMVPVFQGLGKMAVGAGKLIITMFSSTAAEAIAAAGETETAMTGVMATETEEALTTATTTEAAFLPMFAEMIAGWASVAGAALVAFGEMLIAAAPFILAGLAIGAAIYLIIKYHKDLMHWAGVAWHGIKTAAIDVWNFLKKFGLDALMFMMPFLAPLILAIKYWKDIKQWGVDALHGLGDAVKFIGKVFEGIWQTMVIGPIHLAISLVEHLVHLFGDVVHFAGHVLHDLNPLNWFGGGGGNSTSRKFPVSMTGNAMNVHILGASASAGKALNGTGRSNQQSTNVNVHPGAFTVNVQGNMDSASMADVKNHVNEQFRQLRYSLKAQGR